MKMNGKHKLLGEIAQRGLLLAALLAMVLTCATAGRAQSSATTSSNQGAKLAAVPATPAQAPAAVTKPSAAPPKEAVASEEKLKSAKGPHEGIVVHGHWTIVVKNPDGTIAAHQEFENTLDPIEGADLLTGLLSGEYTTDGFFVDLYAPNGNGICGDTDCEIFDSRVPALCNGGKFSNGNPCGTLSYTANTGTANNNAIGYSLSGSVTLLPTDGATITTVGSGVVSCLALGSTLRPTTPPTRNGATTNGSGVANAAASSSFITDPPGQFSTGAACGNDTGGVGAFNLLLTSTTISQPVSGGQSIAVTVKITFSGS